jgi:maltose alpha-D-glucosyltransferase/alpha-amylase
MSTRPTLHVPPGRADLGAALGDPAVREALAARLPDWLRARRWFGGQARQLTGVTFAGWLPLPDGAALAMIAATDAAGATTHHPLLLAADPDGAVLDAIERPALRAYLLERLLAGDTLQGHNLRVFGVSLVADEAIDAATSRVVGVEQSNTSVIYGERAIMKVYRRLAAGPNPEVELGRYLTGAGFPAVPRLLATAQLAGTDGFAADLLVLQDFVPNDGDGWAWAVGAAKEALAAAESPERLAAWLEREGTTLDRAASLGETTAQLHATLARATGGDLEPLPVTAEDLASWAATLRREAEETVAALDRAGHTDRALREAVPAAGAIALADLEGGGLQTRVHGDYHLGQVLRSADGWIILDFEGEPARSLAERRRRQSPLVDVAGMVRSWDYAAQTAAADAGGGEAVAALAVRWGATVRERFLAAYWSAAERAPVPFLPMGEADRATLLRAFEAQKALYEVRYEVNNRPAWLHIPAGAVLRLSNDA